jgi:hypothetical protein
MQQKNIWNKKYIWQQITSVASPLEKW